MKLKDSFIKGIEEIVGSENIKLNEPMKKHTTFKVGGPADVLVYPSTYEMIKKVIDVCKTNNVEYFLMGNGSNLIVKDGGVRGVVIKVDRLNEIKVSDNAVTAQCGAILSLVAKTALENSLTGLEFAAGIPGYIGGAVAMNAGAYGGEMSHVLEKVLVINDENNIIELSKEELELGYRTSAILKHGYIVLETTIRLKQGNKEDIKGRMNDLALQRRTKQPLEYPSAGSTFKRPVGYFAGKLIQDAGLKGASVGGAQVSEKHSGFIINVGDASASDILNLIKQVQDEVYNQFGVELQTEVRIIGEELV
ncbi:MAG: UDP-N-acetylmuramate dehydrogenase [Clostridium sp.]